MVLPNSWKEYEQRCHDLLDKDDSPAAMLIHIMGEQMKRLHPQQWKTIDDIQVPYLKRMFAPYKQWIRLWSFSHR
jgi:hypothetical protein